MMIEMLSSALTEARNTGSLSTQCRRNEAKEFLRNKVNFYHGDRDNCNEYAKLLKYLSNKFEIGKTTGKKWDLVIDFCGYFRRHIKSVLKGLDGSVKLYIYISTDSVYDVCCKEFRSGLIQESDSLRPDTNAEINKLADMEDYGHNKLRCEEYLSSHVGLKSNGQYGDFPYICLRLPDVIGPYDNTERFWVYLLWIEQMDAFPLHSQTDSSVKKLSFVYSEDVAGFIYSFIERVNDVTNCQEFVKTISGHSFNIACDETLTLLELLQKMSLFVGKKELKTIDS